MKTRLLLLSAVALLAVLPGCSTDTGDPRKDRIGRVTNALLADVAKSVGKAAFDELTSLGDNPNPGHSAAQGLWTDGLAKASVSLINSNTLSDLVTAWSGHEMPATADAVSAAFSAAAPATLADQKTLISTIAGAISKAAFSVATP